MKLTQTVITTLAAKTRAARAIRTTLALALNCTENWVFICIKKNKDNGMLTTVRAIELIKKATGLNQSEILEEIPETADAD